MPGQHINTQPKNSNSNPETQQHSGQLIYLTRLFETELKKNKTNVAELENNSRFTST